jgi:hypothetical protein
VGTTALGSSHVTLTPNGRPSQLFSWEEEGRILTSNSDNNSTAAAAAASSSSDGFMKQQQQQGRHKRLVLAAEWSDQPYSTGVVFVAEGDVRDPADDVAWALTTASTGPPATDWESG